MDANGLRFWLLASEGDWTREGSPAPGPGPAPSYDPGRRSFRLGDHRGLSFTETPGEAEARWSRPRTAFDGTSTYAFVDPDTHEIRASGAIPDAELPDTPVVHSPAGAIADFSVGVDGVLYVAEGSLVVLRDLRDRWTPTDVRAPDFKPDRICAHPEDGVWVLDREAARFGRVRGLPLPRAALPTRADTVFRPHEENAAPPTLRVLEATLPPDETPIDIAASSEGKTAVLAWRPGAALIYLLSPEGRLGPGMVLSGIQRPFSVGWIDARTIAVLVAVLREPAEGGDPVPGTEVVTYGVQASAEQGPVRLPLGGIYPLVGHDGGPLCRGPGEPARYALEAVGARPPGAPRRLVRLSSPQRATRGTLLRGPEGRPLDGGREGFTWHRAYIEAHLPSQCGARLWLAASDDPTPPAADRYHPHILGDLEAPPHTPRAVWTTVDSELPFHPGVLSCPPEAHRSGLFTVLIQRSGRRVSALRGRFLFVRLELVGDGRASPEIAAVRLYGSRFSYVDRYLPRIYQEQLFEPEASAPIGPDRPPSPADFLERFLSNFEGVLTVLEDRIANAHLLSDPNAAPEEALEWLGRWVGLVFDPSYPPKRRRAALERAMELHRWRGTARGLSLAIDIVTGGAVEGGEVLILEGWRLRRSFATILGADLSDEHDPLLVGVVQSGNSIVGDSLILGDEFRREFLALFEAALPSRPRGSTREEWVQWIHERFIDPGVVDTFFDQLAYRITVLVHDDLDPDLERLLHRILELEAPAHIEWEVAKATHPFMVGLASLVGVDTYLRAPTPAPGIHVDRSRIGSRGFLTRLPALDPRLEGSSP